MAAQRCAPGVRNAGAAPKVPACPRLSVERARAASLSAWCVQEAELQRAPSRPAALPLRHHPQQVRCSASSDPPGRPPAHSQQRALRHVCAERGAADAL